MDPIQLRALNALEPFIALSKSATSPRAAADLITRATSAPNTYIFAELLATPSIQSLRETGGAEYSSHLTLLEVFSWGTYHDYISTPNLPPLNDAQLHKLRLLSLFSLCTTTTPLSYANLQSALALPTARALEDLLIAATYAGLLTAKLSPLTQLIYITSLAPLRDLAPGSVPRLTDTLAAWEGRCTSVLDDLETQIAGVRKRAAERKHAEMDRKAEIERGINSVREAEKPSGNISGGGGTGNAGPAGAAGATKRAFGGTGDDGAVGLGGDDEMDPDGAGGGGIGSGAGMMDVDEAEAAGGGGSARTLRKNARTKFGLFGRRG